ncbi:beta-ketoacyl synthase chain length factor [Xanthomonas fragariae]|uniref:beta-ketoacyl synthase chain length factor n=1 Tax=Xanthomonas fragariae TaxID=48664 RepID=UPI000D54D31C|nr:beta-ketoacyl synthase chain length factor [Xanthomonas fragariae]MDM7554943.1 beta-ketoacyl synthase chain length factor [Xanthomonas fragariae]MDM7558054.1 beta-ketoacyl synthase chain length factor [Xanthomonas fragariae]MDM7575721.1 beta-ketoacyl synthase chain length factor [Xanthomonas fragariae]MDM7578808.1 beta-ketoacyl synthase chain length factor [Xanthomonas fragariae]MDM7589023.1 beta-ketoacyl synthase chain length factor [Xanthomonas fragariae]
MLAATIEGIGFWTQGLPTWDAAVAFVRGGELQETSARPAPQLLAANERRRAPDTVAVSLEAALAACTAAGREPARLPSVFTSTYGDLAIADYMCTTLASDPTAISPTKFHNSVHNAAAGYWTIGTGAMTPATAISASRASFAQGLLEALVQLTASMDAVLLAAYDARSIGPLGRVAPSQGLLGAALVLGAPAQAGKPQLLVRLDEGVPSSADGPLSRHAAGNAMAPMLPLFNLLAGSGESVALYAGPGRVLRVEVQR